MFLNTVLQQDCNNFIISLLVMYGKCTFFNLNLPHSRYWKGSSGVMWNFNEAATTEIKTNNIAFSEVKILGVIPIYNDITKLQ